MKAKVKLQEIVDEMDMDFDDHLTFIHNTTGKIVTLLREFLTAAEDGEEPYDDLPEWQREEMVLRY